MVGHKVRPTQHAAGDQRHQQQWIRQDGRYWHQEEWGDGARGRHGESDVIRETGKEAALGCIHGGNVYDFDSNKSIRTYTPGTRKRWSATHPFCHRERSEANS